MSQQKPLTATKLAIFGLVVVALIGYSGYLISADKVKASEQNEQLAEPEYTLEQKQVDALFQLVISNEPANEDRIQLISDSWDIALTPMVIEVIYLTNNWHTSAKLIEVLEAKTGKTFGSDLDSWYHWIWKQDYKPHSYYPEFKAAIYGLIDDKFIDYFHSDFTSKIRLDEVRWGGVKQDGIPPLRGPKMLEAKEASYLEDDNIVFGLVVNGDARAYPKRILAWHEMFVDTVGGEPVAGVYCTLCGSMILYKTTHEGYNYQLGTSGFLYRSNKLMYDKATQSLWNTLWGKPVIGELADKDIKLERLSVVTTTWADWKRQHPDTQVLSLDTGHSRNYGEGIAYQEYFATDELMFTIPELDSRLANKAEVVALLPEDEIYEPLALDTSYLDKHPVLNETLGKQKFVALTNKAGAVRVYERKDKSFAAWDRRSHVTEKDGTQWTANEDYLVSEKGEKLKRLPSHRAFWFGWYSAYPDTRLIR